MLLLQIRKSSTFEMNAKAMYDVPIDAHSVQHFSYQVAGHGALLKIGDGKISFT
jgi:hypothetical protein